MYIQIKNNKIPIKTVSQLLKVAPNTVYKHCEREHYKKDDKSDSIDAKSFADYIAKMGKYHQERYQFFLKLHNSLILDR